MKKVINGKMYNTETATCVGECKIIGFCDGIKKYSTGVVRTLDDLLQDDALLYDFSIEETLYRKKNGEFFTVHSNAVFHEDFFFEAFQDKALDALQIGGKVDAITEEEAKVWVEEFMSVETYIELFGEPEE